MKRISEQSFKDFFHSNQSDLNHYFSNLYKVFSFIDTSERIDKFFYASVIQVQLSSFELQLLFYTCLYSDKHKGFKILIEKYPILRGIVFDQLLYTSDALLYNKSSF